MFPSKNTKNSNVSITDFLDPKSIVFLEVDERDQAIQTLVDRLEQQKKIKNNKTFFDALIEREKIISTGIGMGVAIPHAKLPEYETFFIAIGIHRKGIHWDSLDGMPVRLIFLIGGPDDRQTEYLQLLSRLTNTLKDEEKRKKMLQSQTIDEIINLFGGN